MEESQSASNSDDNTLMQLRQMNSLLYYKPSQSSLFSERQQKVQPFLTQNVQPQGTATMIINSDEFVYGPTSYLKVQYTITIAVGSAAAYPASSLASIWGQNGSVLNMFNGMRLYHRSGQVLEEIPNFAGQLMNIKRWYLYSENERIQLDALLNQNYSNTIAAVAPSGVFTATALIPLSLMFGVFDNHNEVIPPHLLSGAKMEFVMNSSTSMIGTSLYTLSGANNGNAIAISNINFSLLLDSVQVFDLVKKQLADECVNSGSGLQYTYYTNFQTSTAMVIPSLSNTATAFSIDVQQANTVVKNVFMVVMLNNDLITPNLSKNAFYNCVNNFLLRIGSHYGTSQPMVLIPASQVQAVGNLAIPVGPFLDSQQAYQNTLSCFDSQCKQFSSYVNTNTVSIQHFTNLILDNPISVPPVTDAGNLSVYGMLLDRSCANPSTLSGQPSNNARLINLSGQITGNPYFTAPANAILLVFTTSARVANLFGDSVVIDR